MSQLNSTQRWNQRHGLPLDAGSNERLEHLAKNATSREAQLLAIRTLTRRAGHNARVLGMDNAQEADDFVQRCLEESRNKESEK